MKPYSQMSDEEKRTRLRDLLYARFEEILKEKEEADPGYRERVYGKQEDQEDAEQ